MTVEINRHPVEVPAGVTDLGALLADQRLDNPGTAVAIADAVVARSQWSSTPLTPDMKITVITAVCGG